MIRTGEADSPGLVDRLKAHTPLRRAADLDEIVQAAAWLLSDRSSAGCPLGRRTSRVVWRMHHPGLARP
ncbi:hypothetical protein ACFFHJ_17240 [Planotetraspora thailandica]|uniref:hypothetical protein n=1 Tax=Planotetraspora thailandica TaxID=487172 RepID=UPI001EF18BB9|nr:hypothetical protein [Planotetraspora thailandica]